MLSGIMLNVGVLSVVVPYANSSFGGFLKNKNSVCPWQASPGLWEMQGPTYAKHISPAPLYCKLLDLSTNIRLGWIG